MTATATATHSNIIPFAFEDHLVRVVTINGEPWFVGKDVCEVLGLAKHDTALSRLDDDEKGPHTVGTPGGEQTVIIVSVPGVFRLIFTSRKPEAERFKRWLAHEVLPALGKTGTYTLPGREPAVAPEALTDFPNEEGPLSIHLAKIATLRECRMIHGTRAAARLWAKLGMPKVTDSTMDEMDEGRRCLAHLLSISTGINVGGHTGSDTMRDEIVGAMDGERFCQDFLIKDWQMMAVREPGDGLFIPNCDPKAFEQSPWQEGRHVRALRMLPGALPVRHSIAGDRLRGTFIPAAAIENMPLPAG